MVKRGVGGVLYDLAISEGDVREAEWQVVRGGRREMKGWHVTQLTYGLVICLLCIRGECVR